MKTYYAYDKKEIKKEEKINRAMEKVRKMSDDEIKVRIQDLKQELMVLRFKNASGSLTDTARVKNVKKEIARLMTFQNEKKVNRGDNGKK